MNAGVGCKRKAPDSESTTRPPKAQAVGVDELILEWTTRTEGDCGDGETLNSTSADELIAQGVCFRATDAARQREAGEVGERRFTLKLVDKKASSTSAALADLSFSWWADSADATLMNFNIKSQDLADFSSSLWDATNLDNEEYDGFAIEMGRSPYSNVQVNKMITDACCFWQASNQGETVYIESGDSPAEGQGQRLLQGLFHLFGKTSTLIAHSSDLAKLKIGQDARNLKFVTLDGGGGKAWYVYTGPSEE